MSSSVAGGNRRPSAAALSFPSYSSSPLCLPPLRRGSLHSCFPSSPCFFAALRRGLPWRDLLRPNAALIALAAVFDRLAPCPASRLDESTRGGTRTRDCLVLWVRARDPARLSCLQGRPASGEVAANVGAGEDHHLGIHGRAGAREPFPRYRRRLEA